MKHKVSITINAVVETEGEDIHEAIVNTRKAAINSLKGLFPGAEVKVTKATKPKEAS